MKRICDRDPITIICVRNENEHPTVLRFQYESNWLPLQYSQRQLWNYGSGRL
jgi:hypothetical protein